MSERWETIPDSEKVKRMESLQEEQLDFLSEIIEPEKDKDGCFCWTDYLAKICEKFEKLEDENTALKKELILSRGCAMCKIRREDEAKKNGN